MSGTSYEQSSADTLTILAMTFLIFQVEAIAGRQWKVPVLGGGSEFTITKALVRPRDWLYPSRNYLTRRNPQKEMGMPYLGTSLRPSHLLVHSVSVRTSPWTYQGHLDVHQIHQALVDEEMDFRITCSASKF
jgi:hypothetical protein